MRDRTEEMKSLLQLKHETDLQSLAQASARLRSARSERDSLAATLTPRPGDDDISALTGNDAIWAVVTARRLREMDGELQLLQSQTETARRLAELSFGRIAAFKGLVKQLKQDRSLSK